MCFHNHSSNLFLKRNISNIYYKSEPKESLNKYEEGLTKTREDFVNKLNLLGIKYTKIDEKFYEELEEILIMADLGTKTTFKFMDKLRKRVKEENIIDFEYLKEVIVDELFMIYVNGEQLTSKINYNKDGLTTILFIGVNGVGKTTSIAKLASVMKKDGKKVILIGADTYRAGAVSQLNEWASRIGVDFYGSDETDPASVVFDGLSKAKEISADVALIDTAGRLQNKDNLMKELDKIKRVTEKVTERKIDETLLVIDASTGQNGISQAVNFKSICDITGIILTKLDGTAKGGIVLSIKDVVGIPVKYVGFGEKETDLIPFDIENYIYGLFKEWK